MLITNYYSFFLRGGLESEFAAEIRQAPIAVCQEEANEQHYEVHNDQGCQNDGLQLNQGCQKSAFYYITIVKTRYSISYS